MSTNLSVAENGFNRGIFIGLTIYEFSMNGISLLSKIYDNPKILKNRLFLIALLTWISSVLAFALLAELFRLTAASSVLLQGQTYIDLALAGPIL